MKGNQMTTIPVTPEFSAIEATLVQGDLSRLTSDQRLSYYKAMCESVGLNPLTKPFEYLQFQGKLVLYARKDATEQLRKLHGVSIIKLEKELINDIFTVTAHARDKSGKEDCDMGSLTVKGLTGDAMANAMMKCTTKAKRRVTLSICGLGVLDETEIETIPGEKVIAPEAALPSAPVPDPDAPTAVRSRADIGRDIMNTAKELGLTQKEFDDWSMECSQGAPLKEMTTLQMQDFLEQLTREWGMKKGNAS